MVNDLIKKLRTCPAEERKDIAMKLAKEGGKENINELKNMVNGEIRLLYPEIKTRDVTIENPHWFGIPRFIKTSFEYHPETEEYDYDDQLIGIEALGKTCSKEALDFLKKLKDYRIESYSGIHQDSQGSYYGSWENIEVNFDYAMGPLRKNMNFSRHFEYLNESEEGTGNFTEEDIFHEVKEYPLIIDSINKLKKNFNR